MTHKYIYVFWGIGQTLEALNLVRDEEDQFLRYEFIWHTGTFSDVVEIMFNLPPIFRGRISWNFHFSINWQTSNTTELFNYWYFGSTAAQNYWHTSQLMESTLRKGSREKNCKINQPNSSWKGDHAALGSIGTHITHSLEAGLSRDALLMYIMQILSVDTRRFLAPQVL